MQTKITRNNRAIRAIETKKSLFESAISLFSEQGYDTVTVDEIVSRAGTSKGAFYIHFKSKDAVIVEQFRQIDSYYVSAFEQLSSSVFSNSTEKLLAFFLEVLKLAKEHLGLEIIKVVYSSQAGTTQKEDDKRKVLIDESRAIFEIINTIIEEGQNKGEIRTDISSREITMLITRCLRSILFDWCVNDGSFDVVEEGEKFFKIFIMKGLQA